MGINLSIKDVPDEEVERLRERAKRNHRSLQGELRALVQEAVNVKPSSETSRKLTIQDIAKRIRKLDISSRSEAARLVRQDRDR